MRGERVAITQAGRDGMQAACAPVIAIGKLRDACNVFDEEGATSARKGSLSACSNACILVVAADLRVADRVRLRTIFREGAFVVRGLTDVGVRGAAASTESVRGARAEA